MENEELYTTDEENDEEDIEGWDEISINRMEMSFQEFVDKKHNRSLRWDLGKRTIKFDDELREKEYWMKRFENEYMKLIEDESKQHKILVANIHIYIYYVTNEKMLGSSEYPDDFDCLSHFKKLITYYPKHHLTVKVPYDEKYYEYCGSEEIKKIEKRFEKFMCKFHDCSLNWDFLLSRWYPLLKSAGYDHDEFSVTGVEGQYWVSRFEEEYEKVKEGKDDKDCELVAAIHLYMHYRMGDPILGSEDFPDDQGCLEHLEEKIIYINAKDE